MKTHKKNIFIQDSGIFYNKFVVCTGISAEELKKYAKAEKLNKNFFKVIFDECEYQKPEKLMAYTYSNAESNIVYLVSFPDFEDTWDFWNQVLHEVVHVVQANERKSGLFKEDEARAYLTEYLFTNIRRKLMSGKYKFVK